MRKKIILLSILIISMVLTSCVYKRDISTPNEKNVTTLQSDNKSIPTNSLAPKVTVTPSEKDISSFIPDGWNIAFGRGEGEPVKVEGDLNNDGISDFAAILEGKSTTDEAPPRKLLIAFGNSDKTYSLSIIADNAILRKDEGGVWGDPLDSISIDKGSILLDFYGGSSYRWFYTYRFRFMDDGWYLIGATTGTFFVGNTTTVDPDVEDYNLLTGNYIFKKADENGKMITTNGNRGIKPLVNLKDFNIHNKVNY